MKSLNHIFIAAAAITATSTNGKFVEDEDAALKRAEEELYEAKLQAHEQRLARPREHDLEFNDEAYQEAKSAYDAASNAILHVPRNVPKDQYRQICDEYFAQAREHEKRIAQRKIELEPASIGELALVAAVTMAANAAGVPQPVTTACIGGCLVLRTLMQLKKQRGK